jgi:hypothetical protein
MAASEPAVSKEYQVKAAFLYNFTKFVEWPAERFVTAESPIVIGVLGANPFGGELEKIVWDRKVNGRPINIVLLKSPLEGASMHAMFIAAGAEKGIEKHFDSLTRAGVLLVGESERFAALEGTVTFTTIGNKVRFEINMLAAEQGGLKISSQLQKLATAVHRAP